MARRGLTYTQVINGLKVLLPVTALALLSTMFLFARSVTPTSQIPFAKIELEERASEQRITSPFFAGQTVGNHNVRVTARSARPDQENASLSHVEGMQANVEFQDGQTLSLSAETGKINSLSLEAELSGGARAEASNGYSIQTDAITLNLNEGTAKSDTKVTGFGPAGAFEAGAMELTYDEDAPDGRFLFTNGVKLVYTPQSP